MGTVPAAKRQEKAYPVAYVLGQGVVRVELRDDCGGKDAEWICHEVIAEPSES